MTATGECIVSSDDMKFLLQQNKLPMLCLCCSLDYYWAITTMRIEARAYLRYTDLPYCFYDLSFMRAIRIKAWSRRLRELAWTSKALVIATSMKQSISLELLAKNLLYGQVQEPLSVQGLWVSNTLRVCRIASWSGVEPGGFVPSPTHSQLWTSCHSDLGDLRATVSNEYYTVIQQPAMRMQIIYSLMEATKPVCTTLAISRAIFGWIVDLGIKTIIKF